MSGRVWPCEIILARQVRGGEGDGYRQVWSLCTATMYRARPRLALETDPFSLDNYKTVLQINSDLVVSFKSPIARDFRLYFKSKTQVKLSKIYYTFTQSGPLEVPDSDKGSWFC